MKKIKAFTLIEVMISIFIFTTAMLGYMAFHAHSMEVIFDNESAQFAHALAFNLVDEINSMSYDSFGYMVGDQTSTPKKNALVGTASQADTIMADSKLFGSSFLSSPFNILGAQDSTGSYRFYRVVRADSYANKTQSYVQPGTFLSTLYQVDVSVYWPKKGNPTVNCFANYSEAQCNYISIPLVRSNHKY
ncbi:prepilin-type N-terminal cleavage/methylation domain-containing protein [bacterium]|nr:prepilin-type N-terminal cleavage/methylation domain-containing protein [bacterium]